MKPNRTLKIAGGLLAALMMLNTAVRADEGSQASDPKMMSMVDNLSKQMASMQRTIDSQNNKIRDLQSRPAATGGGTTAEPAPMSDYEFGQRLDGALGGAQKWLKDLSFKGDVRLRYEGFQYHSGRTPSNTDDRNRFRFRLRFGWEKKFSDDLKVGFGLASGESTNAASTGVATGINSEPTSTNQSLTGDWNFKNIWIEKVYVSYTPGFIKYGPLQKVNFTAGKFDNPFEKGSSDMIWDRDLKPEGIYEKADFKLLDTENFDLDSYLTMGQLVLQEQSAIGKDSELFAYQLGLTSAAYVPFMERPLQWLGAVSLYQYHNYGEYSNFNIAGTSRSQGNTNADGDATSLDNSAFSVWDFYNEVTVTPMGVPIRPFVEAAINAAPNTNTAGTNSLTNINSFKDRNKAWSIGSKIGGINKKGDWELGYQYKWIEADSTVGNFADSDFGSGGTGKRGSVFKASYALADAVTVGAAAYLVNGLNRGNTSGGVVDEEVRRFQVDLIYKF